LIDDNDITILQRRLDILPTQLEEYFQHMLEKIEDVYQEQTAQIFQGVTNGVQPLSIAALAGLQRENEDPDYALKAEIKVLSDVDIVSTPLASLQTVSLSSSFHLIDIMKSQAEAPPECMASEQSVILPKLTFYGPLETDRDARLLFRGLLR
jgi:hypothetical protein